MRQRRNLSPATFSFLIYFPSFLPLLLSTLYPIAKAGTRGISMFAIAVPSCTVLPTKLQPPPPPPGGGVVGGGVVGGGVGDGVGVGGAESSLIGRTSSNPVLAKQAVNPGQLSHFSASLQKSSGANAVFPGTIA